MLNALSRAALGALKAGKSNLTPKIVQNELPKAMVATTSTCEYSFVFSYRRAILAAAAAAAPRAVYVLRVFVFRLDVPSGRILRFARFTILCPACLVRPLRSPFTAAAAAALFGLGLYGDSAAVPGRS